MHSSVGSIRRTVHRLVVTFLIKNVLILIRSEVIFPATAVLFDLNFVSVVVGHDSENVSPTSVICFGKSSLLQHVVTHVTEDLKLFLSGEIVLFRSSSNHLEHLCFGSNHDSDRRSNRNLFNVQSTKLLIDTLINHVTSIFGTGLFIPNGDTSVVGFYLNSIHFSHLLRGVKNQRIISEPRMTVVINNVPQTNLVCRNSLQCRCSIWCELPQHNHLQG